MFVIVNNRWAISVPIEKQTAARTLAQKAIAAGIPGVQVDGNDFIAVRHVMDEALAKARAGGGPTLVEALTYRLSDHTTADDASRYRGADELHAAWQQEPLLRARKYLTQLGAWSDAQEEALRAECAREVEAAVDTYASAAQAPHRRDVRQPVPEPAQERPRAARERTALRTPWLRLR